MKEIARKQVCTCKNCGNEAEMVVTCRLEDNPIPEKRPAETNRDGKQRVKGQATCSHCGNEAEIWIEL